MGNFFNPASGHTELRTDATFPRPCARKIQAKAFKSSKTRGKDTCKQIANVSPIVFISNQTCNSKKNEILKEVKRIIINLWADDDVEGSVQCFTGSARKQNFDGNKILIPTVSILYVGNVNPFLSMHHFPWFC